MEFVRYALLASLALTPLATAGEIPTASSKQTAATAPAASQFSKSEQQIIKAACQIEHTFRSDRARLLTLREHAVAAQDMQRIHEIDRLGRQLDAWRKAKLQSSWSELGVPARKHLKGLLDALAQPAAATAANETATDTQQTLATGAVTSAASRAQRLSSRKANAELDHLQRLMNRRNNDLERARAAEEAQCAAGTSRNGSQYVSKKGDCVTIRMPHTAPRRAPCKNKVRKTCSRR